MPNNKKKNKKCKMPKKDVDSRIDMLRNLCGSSLVKGAKENRYELNLDQMKEHVELENEC